MAWWWLCGSGSKAMHARSAVAQIPLIRVQKSHLSEVSIQLNYFFCAYGAMYYVTEDKDGNADERRLTMHSQR